MDCMYRMTPADRFRAWVCVSSTLFYLDET